MRGTQFSPGHSLTNHLPLCWWALWAGDECVGSGPRHAWEHSGPAAGPHEAGSFLYGPAPPPAVKEGSCRVKWGQRRRLAKVRDRWELHPSPSAGRWTNETGPGRDFQSLPGRWRPWRRGLPCCMGGTGSRCKSQEREVSVGGPGEPRASPQLVYLAQFGSSHFGSPLEGLGLFALIPLVTQLRI